MGVHQPVYIGIEICLSYIKCIVKTAIGVYMGIYGRQYIGTLGGRPISSRPITLSIGY
jgi:hypothetical protein